MLGCGSNAPTLSCACFCECNWIRPRCVIASVRSRHTARRGYAGRERFPLPLQFFDPTGRVSQVTLARNRSLGGLESGTGSREGNQICVDYASSCRLLGACRHHMVVADVGFFRLALRGHTWSRRGVVKQKTRPAPRKSGRTATAAPPPRPL